MTGYSNFVTSLAELMAGIETLDATSATPFNDEDANAILPSIIADAEGMMYRDPDLDFLALRATNTSRTTVSGNRSVTIPVNYLTIEQVALLCPAGSTTSNGVRVNLSRVSPEFINAMFSDPSYLAPPIYGQSYYAMFNSADILIGPTPDGAYLCEFYGVVTQTPLSNTNTDTYLTSYFPDVFLAAAMVFTSGYQKNFSAAGADNPPQAISWSSHYDALKKGAAFQSARQRFLAAGATAYPPAPQVQGTR